MVKMKTQLGTTLATILFVLVILLVLGYLVSGMFL
jgi:hypothetical protein